jgi:hypothetical protein
MRHLIVPSSSDAVCRDYLNLAANRCPQRASRTDELRFRDLMSDLHSPIVGQIIVVEIQSPQELIRTCASPCYGLLEVGQELESG